MTDHYCVWCFAPAVWTPWGTFCERHRQEGIEDGMEREGWGQE